jgi:hypothetical protein
VLFRSHCSPAAVRLSCHHYSSAAVRMSCHHCSPAAVRLSCHHYSCAAVRMSCHHYRPAAVRLSSLQSCCGETELSSLQSCCGETELTSLFLQTTRLTEHPATACTCTTALYTCHTNLRVPFSRPLSIPGRRESCRESSGKLRPPLQHAISLHLQCAWRSPHVRPECAGIWNNCFIDLLSTCLSSNQYVRARVQPSDHPLRLRVRPSVRNMYVQRPSTFCIFNE